MVKKSELVVLYYFGQRWPSVHHARMRIGCSKLNHDLYSNLHVRDNPSCDCGANCENAEHFFLQCPMFTLPRTRMNDNLNDLLPLNINILLFGSNEFDTETNERVFLAVHQFILDSERFI